MIKVSETLYEAIKNFLNFSPSVANHMENTGNPHGVTKAQVGLDNVTNDRQATEAALNAHAGNTGNPHGVTKTQVGLGNVDNIKQATKQEYKNHITGAADKHSGNDVMYSQSKSVNAKIDELIIEGGGGTMYHDELLNRDLENAHPIEAITDLREQIGTTLVFEGTTTDESNTLLTCADTDSIFVNDSGYMTIPAKTAVRIDVSVTGLTTNAGGHIATGAGGMWYGTKLAMRLANAVAVKDNYDLTALRMSDGETDTAAMLDFSGTSLLVKVKGLADTKMYWRAEIKITNVLKTED